MDLNSLFTTNTILQSLTVGTLVYFFRTWLELKFPSLKINKVWTGAILPSTALVLSVVISFLMPSAGTEPAQKLFSGVLCGFSSSFAFSILKAFLRKQSGMPDSIPPEADK